MTTSIPKLGALAAVALLASCGIGDPILEGERIGVRDVLQEGDVALEAAPASATPGLRAVPLALPPARTLGEWTHLGGGPNHQAPHATLSRSPQLAWSTGIGKGDSRKARITADPVAKDGRIFTLDAHATVSAVSTSGKILWQRDLTPRNDRQGDASGGGLAVSGSTLFVTTGFGEMTALDTASGAIRWVQETDAPVAGAPTVFGNLVYLVGRNNRALAVRTDTGRIEWDLPGTPTASVTTTGASPAVNPRVAIFPFGSAEAVATLRQGGIRVWSATAAGKRRGNAYAGFTDITGAPVIVGQRVYVSNPSGRTVALNLTSGERIWTATEGTLSPVLPVGSAVFLVSDQGQLVRLSAEDGTVTWAADLPNYTKDKPQRRKAVFAHYGPILAGGLLRVASDDGILRSFDPISGALVTSTDIPGGATTNPLVIGNTLYLVSERGQLQAYR